MGENIRVLDHGYVQLVEAWGHGDDNGEDFERGIISAARQSTQGSFRGWEQDAKLLKHLYDHKHSTPFEFAGMVIEVRAPIFVFREWHRHRTQSYNEMSARYAPLPADDYVPTFERLMTPPSQTNKQAGSLAGTRLTADTAISWLNDLRIFYEQAEVLYQRGLQFGVPKELARLPVPVGRYSQMRAVGNLRNWLAFLTLRMDPAAQAEIRMYANAVGSIIANVFPQTWSLFNANVEHRSEVDVPPASAG